MASRFNFIKVKQSFTWNINCSNGSQTTITAQLNGSTRDPIDIIVDYKKIATVKVKKKGILPSLEYEFSCGDDQATLVVYGSSVDLAYNGILQDHKIAYNPQESLSKWYIAFLALINLGSLALFSSVKSFSTNLIMQLVLAIPMAIAGVIFSYQLPTSPFYSKNKKIIYSLLMTIWIWVVMFVIVRFVPDFMRL